MDVVVHGCQNSAGGLSDAKNVIFLRPSALFAAIVAICATLISAPNFCLCPKEHAVPCRCISQHLFYTVQFKHSL